MFNPFLILYFILILFFLFGVFAVVFHLLVYRMNQKFSVLVTLTFLTGAGILFLINAIIALTINWSAVEIIF